MPVLCGAHKRNEQSKKGRKDKVMLSWSKGDNRCNYFQVIKGSGVFAK
jgi:hypothetical protein